MSDDLEKMVLAIAVGARLTDEDRNALRQIVRDRREAATTLATMAETNARLEAEIAKLSDPNAVHVNMLRGVIAKPSLDQIRHLYPEAAGCARGQSADGTQFCAVAVEAMRERDEAREIAFGVKGVVSTTGALEEAARFQQSWHAERARADTLASEVERLREALKPFALISSEGVVKAETGYVTVTTCAEYFHRARAALDSTGGKR